MPIDYRKYPANWKEIRARILARAQNKCEECGVLNHEWGARDRHGQWHDQDEIDGMKSDTGEAYFGEYPKIVRIVLTISHTDHDINNNADDNLRALCQRCHLHHDREHHAKSRRRNRDVRTGQRTLIEEPTP